SAMDFDLDVTEEIKEDDQVIAKQVEADRIKPEQQFVSHITDKAAGAGLQTNGMVRLGHPAEEILGCARENSCDIIVMGTHGRGPVATAVMGSIVTKVIRGGVAPVLVVPAAD
ncbi:MAG: universal stress protein, partial [Actinomycetota bacterium]